MPQRDPYQEYDNITIRDDSGTCCTGWTRAAPLAEGRQPRPVTIQSTLALQRTTQTRKDPFFPGHLPRHPLFPRTTHEGYAPPHQRIRMEEKKFFFLHIHYSYAPMEEKRGGVSEENLPTKGQVGQAPTGRAILTGETRTKAKHTLF